MQNNVSAERFWSPLRKKHTTKRIAIAILAIAMIITGISCDHVNDGTVAFNKRDTLVIAHRGLSGLEVENTASAFTVAGERSYYGIEADVRMTLDGKLIICHDDTLKRLSGQEISVNNSTFEKLMSIPLYDKNSEIPGDERLTDLHSFISICKQYDKQAILELKQKFNKEEIAGIIDVIKDNGYIDRVTFISFDYDNLLYVRSLLPEQPAMYLFSELDDEITARLIRDKIDVGIRHDSLTRAALSEFHNGGLKVNCWTVDNKARAEKLARWGVDYITTNILE